MRGARADIPVRSFDFGPGLLQKNDPDLSAARLAENWTVRGCEDWNHIVDNQLAWNSPHHNDQLVDPMARYFKVIVKDSLDPLFIVGEGCDGRQKVAVAYVSLLNIVGTKVILHHDAVLHNFSYWLPGDLPTLYLKVQ